jgi:molybdenum cofactor cytidylyltransferase
MNAPEHEVAVVLLAAGASTRMGRPKQLLPYAGSTLLRHAVETAIASKCSPVIVVLGAEADACRGELSGLPVDCVENPNCAQGIGTSIHAGLSAVPTTVGAVVLTVCDQPLVTGEHIDALVDSYLAGAAIVASAYAGTIGVPALFSRAYFGGLARLGPTEGAKRLLTKHAAAVYAVDFEAGAVDIDTKADYRRRAPSPRTRRGASET